jgi:hypothetical protein
MERLVKDESLSNILAYGMCHISSLEPEYDFYICNICRKKFKFRMDVLHHIIENHMNDKVSNVNPFCNGTPK